VVLHQTTRLHERVADGRTDESELRLQALAHAEEIVGKTVTFW
jgi:hypothetical protein